MSAEVKKCEECGEEYKRRIKEQRFCSKVCRDKAYHLVAFPPLSTSTKGAISEMMVGADLLLRGYEVFRALSPACSCDLIAMKEGNMLRIEVRTGRFNKDSRKLYFVRNGTSGRHAEDILDHYAIVSFSDEGPQVTYEPELP